MLINSYRYAASYTPITATGGTVTDVSIAGRLWRVHDFTSSGDLVITDLGSNPEEARALLVAAGASGGCGNSDVDAGSGGGAGGEVKEFTPTLTVDTFPIVIGAGGAAVTGTAAFGLAGSDSTAFGQNCDGGGYGGYYLANGGAAVNGGGGGGSRTFTGASKAGGTGTRAGGAGRGDTTTAANRSGGGGAGAGTAGGNGAVGVGGAGGDGVQSSINGTATYYGAGAGGMGATPGAAGLGGVAGVTTADAANDGTDGLGNGGSGVTKSGASSGKGGKGRFIFAHPLEAA
jgi:hypothetical protein